MTEASPATPVFPSWIVRHRHSILLVLGLCVTAFAYRDLVAWEPGRAMTEDAPAFFVASNTSPGYIGFLCFVFILIRRYRFREAMRNAAPSVFGWLAVAPALALFAWAHYSGARDLLLLSLIPMIMGTTILVLGGRGARVLMLPVFFIIFAYPMPGVVINQQVWAFQRFTAEFATGFIQAIGLEAILEGDLIYTRGRIFEVVETCSGLRLTETLITSAFAYGEIMRVAKRHKILLILCSPFVGVFLNGVRVLMIIFTPVTEFTQDHTFQGIAVIVVGVLTFAVIEWVLRIVWPAPPETFSGRPDSSGASLPIQGVVPLRSAWLLVVPALCLGLSYASPRWDENSVRVARWAISIPTTWEGWEATKLEKDEKFLGSVYESRALRRKYEKDGDWVDVVAARENRLRRDRSILSEKNAVPGSGWRILEESEIGIAGIEVPVKAVVATRRGQRALIYHWYEGSLGLRREVLRSFLGLENSRFRTGGELRMFRVATNLDEGTASRERARERLEMFARKIRVSLDG